MVYQTAAATITRRYGSRNVRNVLAGSSSRAASGTTTSFTSSSKTLSSSLQISQPCITHTLNMMMTPFVPAAYHTTTIQRAHLSTISLRPLSTTTATATAAAAAAAGNESNQIKNDESKKKEKKEKTTKDDDSNIFLDNLGKIFLAVIGFIIGWLVRGSYGTSNRNKLRDSLEDLAALDPLEVDDLRVANSELTADVFGKIVQDVYQSHPQGMVTYSDFCKTVRHTMAKLKGEAFTIELGHLLDRVIFNYMKEHHLSVMEENESALPIAFFLTALSLSLSSSVPERINVLYQVLQHQQQCTPDNTFTNHNQNHGEESSSSSSSQQDMITFQHVIDMVGYLQHTCQLPPDSQVIASDVKYPTQQYKRGTPEELVHMTSDKKDDKEDDEDAKSFKLDQEAFSEILRTKSVCAWGQCYDRKKVFQNK